MYDVLVFRPYPCVATNERLWSSNVRARTIHVNATRSLPLDLASPPCAPRLTFFASVLSLSPLCRQSIPRCAMIRVKPEPPNDWSVITEGNVNNADSVNGSSSGSSSSVQTDTAAAAASSASTPRSSSTSSAGSAAAAAAHPQHAAAATSTAAMPAAPHHPSYAQQMQPQMQHPGGASLVPPSVSSVSSVSASPPLPPSNAYLTPDGDLFYVTTLRMHERGVWVPITHISIMDPGFVIPQTCDVSFKDDYSFPRDPAHPYSTLNEHAMQRFCTVDAFLHTPEAGTAAPLVPPEIQAKYEREYVKFFLFLSKHRKAARVTLPYATFFFIGPDQPAPHFDATVPVRMFFQEEKIVNRAESQHVAPPMIPSHSSSSSSSSHALPPQHHPAIAAPRPVSPALNAPSYAHVPSYLTPAPMIPPPQHIYQLPPLESQQQQLIAMHQPIARGPYIAPPPPPPPPPPAASLPAEYLPPLEPHPAAVSSAGSASSASSSAVAAAAGAAAPATTSHTSSTAALQISPHFLRDLTHTHDWVFGALAELVHNSRDAKAKTCRISVQRLGVENKPHVIVEDDGCGMTHEELKSAFAFGRVTNRTRETGVIGKFGFGLKHGTMRVGDDALVLTKTTKTFSVGFLSQTFNESLQVAKAPIITRLKAGFRLDTSVHSQAETEEAEEIIKKYSAFNHFMLGKELLAMPEVGTRIYIWNLRPETTAAEQRNAESSDDEEDEREVARRIKLRAQAELKKQQTMEYKKKEAAAAAAAAKASASAVAPASSSTATSVVKSSTLGSDDAFELKFSSYPGDIQIVLDPVANYRIRSNQMSTDVPCDYSLRAYLSMLFLHRGMKMFLADSPIVHLDWRKALAHTKEYECSLKSFRGCRLLLGFSEEEKQRGNSGCMLYWHDTLIESYRRVGIQTGNTDAGLGVIGVMDIGDSGVLEPNNNKQAFPASNKHFLKLLKWLSTTLDRYWHEELKQDLVVVETDEVARLLKQGRIESRSHMVECEKCRKWRRITDEERRIVAGEIMADGSVGDGQEKSWYCYMNKDKAHASCDVPQAKDIDENEKVTDVSRGAARPDSSAARASSAKSAAAAASAASAASAAATRRAAARQLERQLQSDNDDDDDAAAGGSSSDIAMAPSSLAASSSASAPKSSDDAVMRKLAPLSKPVPTLPSAAPLAATSSASSLPSASSKSASTLPPAPARATGSISSAGPTIQRVAIPRKNNAPAPAPAPAAAAAAAAVSQKRKSPSVSASASPDSPSSKKARARASADSSSDDDDSGDDDSDDDEPLVDAKVQQQAKQTHRARR